MYAYLRLGVSPPTFPNQTGHLTLCLREGEQNSRLSSFLEFLFIFGGCPHSLRSFSDLRSPSFLRSFYVILILKQTYQTHRTKPKLTNRTYQTKPTKPNLTDWTIHTTQNLSKWRKRDVMQNFWRDTICRFEWTRSLIGRVLWASIGGSYLLPVSGASPWQPILCR